MSLQYQLEKKWHVVSTKVDAMDLSYLTPANIWSCLDLTLLNQDATPDAIQTLVSQAQNHAVAAICVFPSHLEFVSLPSTIKRATVVNFPSGDVSHKDVLRQIEQAITDYYADEIDYVFPYTAYLAGREQQALACCLEAYTLCRQSHTTFKVILETGALSSLEVIYRLSIAVLEQGCDFLKTSTGKIPIGATLPAAFAILEAMNETQIQAGIKLSGGIKTLKQAAAYVSLAQYMRHQEPNQQWFRIGTSCLIN